MGACSNFTKRKSDTVEANDNAVNIIGSSQMKYRNGLIHRALMEIN